MAKKIDTIVLDKTGAITEGKPVVTDIVWETEMLIYSVSFWDWKSIPNIRWLQP